MNIQRSDIGGIHGWDVCIEMSEDIENCVNDYF